MKRLGGSVGVRQVFEHANAGVKTVMQDYLELQTIEDVKHFKLRLYTINLPS